MGEGAAVLAGLWLAYLAIMAWVHVEREDNRPRCPNCTSDDLSRMPGLTVCNDCEWQSKEQ